MNKKKKIDFITRTLEHYFPDPDPPLYHKDIYTLLIAVLLSARTTDAQVNKVTPYLFAKADSPQKMVKLNYEEILEIIRTCGLSPRKAQNILDLSQILLDHYHGQVPNTFDALEALPGVGHKTASVVMVQGFHQPAFPIDTHIERCARRWGLSKHKSISLIERDLKKIFPENSWGKVHLQIIYFARQFCPAKGHHPHECPICSFIL